MTEPSIVVQEIMKYAPKHYRFLAQSYADTIRQAIAPYDRIDGHKVAVMGHVAQSGSDTEFYSNGYMIFIQED